MTITLGRYAQIRAAHARVRLPMDTPKVAKRDTKTPQHTVEEYTASSHTYPTNTRTSLRTR